MASKPQKFISHISRGWKSRIKALAGLVSGEGWLPGSPMAASHCAPPYMAAEVSLSLLCKGTNATHVGCARTTKHLLKLLHSHTLTLGIRFYHMNLGGAQTVSIAIGSHLNSEA